MKRVPSLPWLLSAAVFLLVLAGCGGAPSTGEDLSGDDLSGGDVVSSSGTEAQELVSSDTVFSGALDASGTSWVTQAFAVKVPGTLTATLSWDDGSADLNLFLTDPAGNRVAHGVNSTTARPEGLSADVTQTGSYQFGIKCKTGHANYTLTVHFEPSYQLYTFTGSLSASGTSWVVHPFDVKQGQRIEATLDWAKSAANLDLYLRDPAPTGVAHSNGTSKPEQVAFTATTSGKWSAGVKCKSGSTSYTLTVKVSGTATGFVPSYPGQPKPGTLFWGSTSPHNDPETRFEQPSGHTLALRRSYYQWSERTGKMITIAQADLSNGRLPWVSIKTPVWSEMASGAHDAEIDQMLKALAALPGPVWLTIYHEPENDPDMGTPAQHVAMNKRVRQRMTALGVKNVALGPILMSYTFKSGSGRNPADWWADGIYDFFGVDHYAHTGLTLLDTTWSDIRQFAGERGVNVAVGEWGQHGTDSAAGQAVHAWFEAGIASGTDGKGARVVGMAAFDSDANSPDGGWTLEGAQLTAFLDIMADGRVAHLAGGK